MSFKLSFTNPAVAALCLGFIGGTTPAYADLGDQRFELLPIDGAEFDNFGRSVAISGTTAIVGAWRDVDKGIQSGSAYLFNTTTGAQITKLVPNDGEFDDRFGISVAISGATAVVGARYDDDNGFSSGSAYLFDTNTGLQIAKLLPSDGEEFDEFGNSVAISDTITIVGALKDNNGNGETAGSAYLFDVSDPRNPVEIAKLLPDDGALSDEFGVSVAISGGIAIAGADSDDDNGTESGSAYMFDTTTCLGDLNDDDIVGVGDLLILLGFWGPCGPVCLGDLDGDDNVGVSDFLILLGNWGPCP